MLYNIHMVYKTITTTRKLLYQHFIPVFRLQIYIQTQKCKGYFVKREREKKNERERDIDLIG